MKVFLSWSGEVSREIAQVLRGLIPLLLPDAKPFLSSADIGKGAQWLIKIGKELEEFNFGIICLTRENLTREKFCSQWIAFEAGAMSRFVAAGRIVTVLFGVDPEDIQDPLSMFQCIPFNQEGFQQLILSINRAAPEHKVRDEGQIVRLFPSVWGAIESEISKILSNADASMPKRDVPISPRQRVAGKTIQKMVAEREPIRPIRLFYSYSHRDENLRQKLQKHLAVLRWNGMITEWHDRDIEAGADWETEIEQHLSSADIILLLFSASFTASKYCWSVEAKKALERHECGEARVIPVILRPCQWQSTPFARLQATPKNAKAVTAWRDPDAAFNDVVSKIEAVVLELQRKHSLSPMIDSAKPSSPESEEPWSATSRDCYGSWMEIRVPPITGTPVTQRLRWIPPGQFQMGSPDTEPGRFNNEGPQHWVTLSQGFWLFDTACTQALWEAVMGKNPSSFTSSDRTSDVVSLDEVERVVF